MTDKIQPHDTFSYTRPDEVAECWDGVYGTPGLYEALWDSMSGMKPISEQIDMEDSGPGDAIGLNTLASVWDKLDPAHQTKLNELAAAQEAEWEAGMARANAELDARLAGQTFDGLPAK